MQTMLNLIPSMETIPFDIGSAKITDPIKFDDIPVSDFLGNSTMNLTL